MYGDVIPTSLRLAKDHELYVVFGENLEGQHTLPKGFQEVPLYSQNGWRQHTIVGDIKKCCPMAAVERRYRDDPDWEDTWTLAAFRFLHTLPDVTRVLVCWHTGI